MKTIQPVSLISVSPTPEECAKECRACAPFSLDFNDIGYVQRNDNGFQITPPGLTSIRGLYFSVDIHQDGAGFMVIPVIQIPDTGFYMEIGIPWGDPAGGLQQLSGYIPLVANPTSTILVGKTQGAGAAAESRIGNFALLNYDVQPFVIASALPQVG